MGKRGPKPVDIGLLSLWEFELYKAFHLLRDGTSLPTRNLPPPSDLKPSELRAVIVRLKCMSPAEYWRVQQQLTKEFSENVDLEQAPTKFDIESARRSLDDEVYRLKRTLEPRRIQAQVRRRKIWDDLVRANTYAALRKACGRWSQMLDVRASGLTPFPEHVRTNAGQFLFMKRNKRFPRSNYGDDARIEYLARGMAGVLVGVSPMTAIERLRNMRHDAGGPLWDAGERRCKCWRCSLNRSTEMSKITQGWYENGLRRFIELADEMKHKRS
jgi:hypothetical protein